MKVRVHGGVTYYCGEIELNLSSDYNGSIEIISDDITPLEPRLVTAKAAMADENIGNLMRVEGKITEIHKTAGVIDKIYVQDETGTALLFINGYITSTDTSLDKLTVGMTVSGIGIGSRDVDEESADSAIFARLRVRDRADIHEISAPHTHTWGPWETTEPAGCFHEGTQTRSCSGCGTTETRTIPANSDNCPSKAFTDRPDRGWYHESVDYVLETGLMNGMGKGKFEPDTTLNRAMVATVLYRLSGDKVSATNAFPGCPGERVVRRGRGLGPAEGHRHGLRGRHIPPDGGDQPSGHGAHAAALCEDRQGNGHDPDGRPQPLAGCRSGWLMGR